MLKKVIVLLFLLLFFTSCSEHKFSQVKISATTWIGYTPLFYAKAKGWLDPLNIKLMNISSLGENMSVYKAGKSDAYVGTQYEFNHLQDKNLIPIMMFDRSNGGDIIMSNVSIEALQNAQTIDAYLEIDSINSTLLNAFIKKHGLEKKNINRINRDQTYISVLESKFMKKESVIVTYIPYNIKLEKHGFVEIASTKNNLDLLVVDAMFTSKTTFLKHQEQFVQLKRLVDRAVDDLNKDPKMFYETIKLYMNGMTYEDFKASLEDIVWINKPLKVEVKKSLEASEFPLRNLL